MIRRLAVLAALLAALALALPACGEKQESTAAPRTQPLTLVLDYFPNADHAGIYAAQARGLFRPRASTSGSSPRPTRPRR